MAQPISGMLGVDLASTTAGTTTDGVNAKFALGTSILGSDGSRWVYVQAGAAITQYFTVAIDENFQAVHITSTLAKAGHGVGFAQVAFADNDFGWVCTHSGGNISVRVAAACAPDVQLYTTATAGVLDDTATTTACLLRGVVIVLIGLTASASTREAIATYPSATATP